MNFSQILHELDWKMIMLGKEEWGFLMEVLLRTATMFLVILTGLRILGKRGIKQLSIFELVVIIGLGSAAGDPMFYKDVGIFSALVVFAVVIVLYKLVVYLIGRSNKFENLIEGKPVRLIKEGVFSMDNFKKEHLGADEFFAELRLAGISHLGQIEEAIVETSGEVSIFYYTDKEVKYGLPVMPGMVESSLITIREPGYYSCAFCGYTEKLKPVNEIVCPVCKKNKWVKSSNKLRIR